MINVLQVLYCIVCVVMYCVVLNCRRCDTFSIMILKYHFGGEGGIWKITLKYFREHIRWRYVMFHYIVLLKSPNPCSIFLLLISFWRPEYFSHSGFLAFVYFRFLLLNQPHQSVFGANRMFNKIALTVYEGNLE